MGEDGTSTPHRQGLRYALHCYRPGNVRPKLLVQQFGLLIYLYLHLPIAHLVQLLQACLSIQALRVPSLNYVLNKKLLTK